MQIIHNIAVYFFKIFFHRLKLCICRLKAQIYFLGERDFPCIPICTALNENSFDFFYLFDVS